MKQAAIITIWFGKLPAYFPLWVRSLKANENFDFLLYTDQIVSLNNLPANLKVHSITFTELKNHISKTLGLKAAADAPYKLCDFRPAYGEIFAEELKDYEFWGHCDIDLMFGKLENFITRDILLLNRKVFNRGHLTLFRNEASVNSLYRSSKNIDYKMIFESPEYYMFDEWHGIHKVFKEYGIEQYHNECIADIEANAARFVCTKIENYKKQLFIWEDGLVKQYYLKDGELHHRELAYIHFQKRKLQVSTQKVFTSKSVIFTPFSFVPFDGEVTPALIRKFDKGNYNHYLKRQSDRILKKLNLLSPGPVIFNQTLKSIEMSA
ncbi:DUF6625 family protein [Desertivirga brevis]|uniref:DUF6625 family protein n=1 Tax=Desertivirga brevis TaxID=2810310 RepID=UPI001A962845|nr:DUF6625 family protein [Pedobacter sp. SYSU D00873]